MGLSTELISQFAKITNDRKVSRIDEATLYGEVIEYDDRICVKFDGSEEATPVTTIVEKDEDGQVTNFKYGAASVKTGDRVSVSLKNHSATITGNLSDPPPSRAEVIVGEDSILARVDEISVKMDSLGVSVNGLVTFTNGLSDGTTSIDGGCIKTGKIDAQYLQLSGAISFGDLSDADDVTNSINNALNTATDAKSTADSASYIAYEASIKAANAKTISDSLNSIVSDWGYTYNGQTYIDGGKIMTGTVRASTIQGGSVQLLDQNELTAATFTLTGASSYEGSKLLMASGAIELRAVAGAAFLYSANGTYLQLSDTVSVKGILRPSSTNDYSLGTSENKWTDVYATNGTIITSDATKKKDVNSDLTGYDKFFDSLSPCSYKFIDGESGRTHLGLISQEIEKSLSACGMTSLDFAGFIKTPKEDQSTGYDYALRYTEFIPLLVWQVQKLKARVAELEVANG